MAGSRRTSGRLAPKRRPETGSSASPKARVGPSPSGGRRAAPQVPSWAGAPDRTAAWKALASHARSMRRTDLATLFARDRRRGERLSAEALGMRLDYSKNLLDATTLRLLVALARERKIAAKRAAMFRGERINPMEDRAALHVALRAPAGARILHEGRNVVPEVHAVLRRMAGLARAVRARRWLGFTGRPIRSVVNVGIGGSDLGPVMAYEALRAFSDRGLSMRFVSNVDASDFHEATEGLDPEETLFVISSKTFTTLETMTNARTARDWSLAKLRDPRSVARHFVAVSTNAEKVAEFGIDVANMFGFWDWVGGRYSMDSAIGLSTMIAIGPERFAELLAGFHDVDEHFRTAPPSRNLPMLLALVGIWNRNFLGHPTLAVLPYSHDLRRFSAYLQQLEMESNGKRVQIDGRPVGWETCPVLWGEPGTNGQHAFYQMIHQGTSTVPCDFIAFARPLHDVGSHQDLLVANVLAQAEALAFGKSTPEVLAEGTPAWLAPHRTFPGNRPSNVLLCEALSPRMLGRLVALYEHKTFVQGAIWNVNSFDQWGVELGKVLAQRIVPELSGRPPKPAHDSSTQALIGRYRTMRGR